ncbi:MAG: hypothetical protein ACR2OA_03635 [Rubripirellula sp.]
MLSRKQNLMQADISDQSGQIEIATNVASVRMTSGWLRIFLVFASVLGLVCGGGILFLMYVAIMGPATYVYPPGQTPQRFLAVAKEVGGLQPGEKVEFFYSVGFTDVREGFTYVSDQKVVVYDPEGEPPLVTIDYGDIQGLEFTRNESFLLDSVIAVETEDSYELILVASEKGRDVEFYEAIRARVRDSE